MLNQGGKIISNETIFVKIYFFSSQNEGNEKFCNGSTRIPLQGFCCRRHRNHRRSLHLLYHRVHFLPESYGSVQNPHPILHSSKLLCISCLLRSWHLPEASTSILVGISGNTFLINLSQARAYKHEQSTLVYLQITVHSCTYVSHLNLTEQ